MITIKISTMIKILYHLNDILHLFGFGGEWKKVYNLIMELDEQGVFKNIDMELHPEFYDINRILRK